MLQKNLTGKKSGKKIKVRVQKISNKKVSNNLWALCLLGLTIIISFWIITYLRFPEFQLKINTIGILSCLNILLLFLFIQVFDFENTGEIIIIKNYNVFTLIFRNYFLKKVELSNDKILECKIKKTKLSNYLIVKISGCDGSIRYILFSIQHLSDEHIYCIQSSINQS